MFSSKVMAVSVLLFSLNTSGSFTVVFHAIVVVLSIVDS